MNWHIVFRVRVGRVWIARFVEYGLAELAEYELAELSWQSMDGQS